MGSSQSNIPADDLDDYSELTYLTKKEIIHAWDRWQIAVRDSSDNALTNRYDERCIQNIEELKHNPFKKRLTIVFSSQNDGKLSFEDFLDLLSVMCPEAPVFLKAYYAFRMYDLDEDNYLTENDLSGILSLLTENQANERLTREEKTDIIQKVLHETDMDGDGITLEEFRHLVLKCPDFLTSFKLTI